MKFESTLEPSPSLVYPILEVRSKNPLTGEEQLIGPCCFHDLLGGTDSTDLAGMGLTILANMVQGLHEGILSQGNYYGIGLQMAPGSKTIRLPWPGMPDDRPIPLDLEKIPLDYTMFLDKSEGKFMRRLDRVGALQKIRETWVPHLMSLMRKNGQS